MKRSTLTLSILTALLVSACGGSSSNDEQTKDPTPPKVTPTQPSTPSTGRTPTTGKTEPKKEEASSSSSSDSSDPTPPISSGSAPSGGKPIVIAGEPKKEVKPDQPDEDENTEEEKPEDKPSDALSDIAKKLQESETAFKAARIASEEQKLKVTQAERDVSDLRTKIDDLLPTDKKLNTDETVAALTKNVDADTAKKINDLYDKYVAAEKAAADAVATDDELRAAADAAEIKHKENETASEIEEFKKEWADKPQVLSVTEYVEAKTAEMEAQGQKGLAEKKNRKLTDQRNVFGNAKQANGRITKLNGKLAALKRLSSKDPAVQAKIDAAIKRTEEELADANKRWEELHKEVQHAKTDEELAKGKAGAIKAADLQNKADTAKNFGVAGGKDFVAEKIFLGVQKAVKDGSGVWTITFDGMNEGVEVNPAAGMTNIGNVTTHGKSGTVGTESKPAAFRLPKDSDAASIYGYFDDKFYSAGTVTTPEQMDKVLTTKVGEFSGTSFLVDTAGNKLVSDVKGTVRLGGEKKEFEGDFQNFQKVGTNLEPINDGRLKNYVHFKAEIDKNTFKPAADTEAKVYGYFYGTNADEAGGLVELQDVFHGSFGGEIKRQ